MSRGLPGSLAVVLLAATVCAVAVAQGSGSRVEKIVADESLFPKDFASAVDWKGMRVDSRWKLWVAVPESQRPRLDAVLQKYGKEQSTADEVAPALRSGSLESTDLEPPAGVPTRKVRVYYFDHVGLAVDTSQPEARVVLITNRPAARKQ